MSTKKLSTMFCDICKKDLTCDNFLPNQEYCFHCVYKIKTGKVDFDKVKKRKKVCCRVCKKEVPFNGNVKKRQRTVYCSNECSVKGHQSLKNNYWTRKLRVLIPLAY